MELMTLVEKQELPSVVTGELSGRENSFRIESVSEWVWEVPQNVMHSIALLGSGRGDGSNAD